MKSFTILICAGVIGGVLVIPFLVSAYWIGILTSCTINATTALAFLLMLRAGHLNFGTAGFMAIGAYTCVLLVTDLGVSFWPALVAGGTMASLVGILVGYIFLRVGGLSFVLLTFSFSELLRLLAIHWSGLTGGPAGIPGIPPPRISVPGLVTYQFAGKIPYFYLGLCLLFLAVVVVWRMQSLQLGRIVSALGLNVSLSKASGINTLGRKVLVFSVCCFLIGLSGAVEAQCLRIVYPDEFSFYKTFWALMMVLIGGIRYPILGPLIGAVFMTFLVELTRPYMIFAPLIYGGVIMATVFLLPGGFVSLKELTRQQLSFTRMQ
jgi:branched-chain amino acid transport system permease protein